MSLSANYPALAPNLLLDFANSKVIDSRIGVTRASTATYFNQLGVLQTAQNNVPRIDFNPTTYACNGLLVEESRTNSIRNNTMVGAVAGTPGTLPMNWSVFAASGLTTTVVATGISNGVSYIDLRFSGTSTNTFYVIAFDNSAVVASAGQSWTESFWVSLISGSLANINSCNIDIRWSTGASDIPFTPTTTFTRISGTAVAPASITNVIPALFINMSNGAAIDITLRIGLPQLEQGAFATSVIPTTTTALTRQADAISMTGTAFSGWFNASEGTFLAQFSASANTEAFYLLASESGGFTVNSFYFDNNGGQIRNVNWSGSSAVAVLNTGAIGTVGATNKLAGAYKVNDFAASRNGGAVVTDTSGAVAVNVNQLSIGRNPNNVANTFISGYIQRIYYYPLRNTNAQLQALTGT